MAHNRLAKRIKLIAKRSDAMVHDAKETNQVDVSSTAASSIPAAVTSDCSVVVENIALRSDQEFINFKSDFDNLKNKLASFEQLLSDLAPISSLIRCFKPHTLSAAIAEDITFAGKLIDSISAEVFRRQQCSKNAIVFNVDDKMPTDRIRRTLLAVADMQSCQCRCTRLKKKVQRRRCPLLFQFSNELDATKFIKIQPHLGSHSDLKAVKIMADRTPLQRHLSAGQNTPKRLNQPQLSSPKLLPVDLDASPEQSPFRDAKLAPKTDKGLKTIFASPSPVTPTCANIPNNPCSNDRNRDIGRSAPRMSKKPPHSISPHYVSSGPKQDKLRCVVSPASTSNQSCIKRIRSARQIRPVPGPPTLIPLRQCSALLPLPAHDMVMDANKNSFSPNLKFNRPLQFQGWPSNPQYLIPSDFLSEAMACWPTLPWPLTPSYQMHQCFPYLTAGSQYPSHFPPIAFRGGLWPRA
jgi:hypothetical protein